MLLPLEPSSLSYLGPDDGLLEVEFLLVSFGIVVREGKLGGKSLGDEEINGKEMMLRAASHPTAGTALVVLQP